MLGCTAAMTAGGPRRLGGAVGVLLLCLLLAEAGTRVVYRPEPVRRVYDPFAYRIPAPGLRDAFVNREGERVEVRLNELGMRGPSLAQPLPPGGLSLVFLGGSTTENYAYAEGDTFPVQVGAALATALARPVRVLNAGMSAGTSSTSLARLQHQVLDLRPDVVVVMDGINDLLDGFHSSYRRDGRHLERPPVLGETPRSYLYDWLRRTWLPRQPHRPRPDQEVRVTDYADFPSRQVFARNLRSMAAIAEAHGVDALFLSMGTMYRDPPEPGDRERFVMAAALGSHATAYPDAASLAAGMRAFNDVVLALPESPHVRVFDLASRLPRSWDVFYDDCHFTKPGNRLVAATLVPPLESILRRRLSAP
jgi:lysophospholipase L1-like esterase